VLETKLDWQELGVVRNRPTEAEQKNLVFRRPIYVAKQMKARDVLTSMSLCAIRLIMRLHSRCLNIILENRMLRDLFCHIPRIWIF